MGLERRKEKEKKDGDEDEIQVEKESFPCHIFSLADNTIQVLLSCPSRRVGRTQYHTMGEAMLGSSIPHPTHPN